MSCPYCADRMGGLYDLACLSCRARNLARSPKPSVAAQLRYLKLEWSPEKYAELVARLKEEYALDQLAEDE